MDDLEDVAQEDVHVLGSHGSAAAVGGVRVVLRPVFPPVRQVAAQHGQQHLHKEKEKKRGEYRTIN